MLCCVAVLAFGACGEPLDASTSESESVASSTVPSHGGLRAPVQPRLDVLVYPFVGTYDPETGLTIEYDYGYDFSTPLFDGMEGTVQTGEYEVEGVLKTGESGWYEIRVTSGRPGTVSLSSTNIGFTPADCGWPNSFPYSVLGTFCFDATVTNNMRWDTTEIYAEITSVAPDTGFNPYSYSFGTTTDPSQVTPDCGGSQGVGTPGGLGVFAHGPLADTEASTLQWLFENAGGPFSFYGRIVALADEECGDGLDNDCDGHIDDGCTGGDCCADNLVGGTLTECGEPVALCPSGEECGVCGFGAELLGVCVPEGTSPPGCP